MTVVNFEKKIMTKPEIPL